VPGICPTASSARTRMPGSEPAASYEELLNIYRACRCMLHVSRQNSEDGLQPRASRGDGLRHAAVALANRTSPITDGVDGYVSSTPSCCACTSKRFSPASIWRAKSARAAGNGGALFPLEAFTQNGATRSSSRR